MGAIGNCPMPLVASVSGGKDSAAMCLRLKELGIPYAAVFVDTGWEAPQTYDYLRGPLQDAIGPIEWIEPPLEMTGLIRKKGIFPNHRFRFCTMELKVYPFISWVQQRFFGYVCNAVGVRAEESRARRRLPPVEEMADTMGQVMVWRPILRWSEAEVIEIHRRHGLRPNPLYLAGCLRVGCWPCVYARKQELRVLSTIDPQRVGEIRSLEREVGRQRRSEGRDGGEERPSTFFIRRIGGYFAPRPIDDVIAWARGPEEEQLDEDAREGCMRWGLCGA